MTTPPATFCVPSDHPCLPGHFPSAPVVPGVVVLDHALAMLPAPCEPPRSLAWVKFVRPLLPGQVATVTFDHDGSQTRFTVSHAGVTIASGVVSGGGTFVDPATDGAR